MPTPPPTATPRPPPPRRAGRGPGRCRASLRDGIAWSGSPIQRSRGPGRTGSRKRSASQPAARCSPTSRWRIAPLRTISARHQRQLARAPEPLGHRRERLHPLEQDVPHRALGDARQVLERRLDPVRSAAQRFSAIRHERGTSQLSCSASHATRQCTNAVTAAASSSVVCASHTRTSSVPKCRCGRSSHHHEPGSGTAQAIASAYSSQDAKAGGTLWRGSSPLISGRTEAKPGVATGVERRVGGQRGQLRQIPAQRVVDGERALGRADRHVHLQRADELRAGHVAEPGDDRRRSDRPLLSSPSGAANGCTPATASRARPSAAAAAACRCGRECAIASLTVATGVVLSSICEAGQLELGARHPGGDGRRSSADRVEEHHFLFEPDRQRLGRRRRCRAGWTCSRPTRRSGVYRRQATRP